MLSPSGHAALLRFGKGDGAKTRAYVNMVGAFLAGRPENTRRNYRCALQQFFTLFDWMCPEDVLPVHAAGFKVWLVERKKVSDATAYNRMSALSSFFDYLCTPPSPTGEPLLRHNPFKHIPRNDIQPSPYERSVAMDWSTFETILNAIPKDAMGLRDRAILLFFAFTGRRRQEVAQLRVRDLRLQDDPPWYEATVKGNKVRKFELPTICTDAIRAYWLAAERQPEPDEGVFCSLDDDHLNAHRPTNRPLANRTMNEILSRAAQRAGLDPAERQDIHIHAIRHMAARDLDRGGARLQDIQAFLGHDSPVTTQIYLGRLAGPAPALTDRLLHVREGARRLTGEAV